MILRGGENGKMGIEVNRITCCGCGAPLEMPQAGAKKIKCPYCDVENIIGASVGAPGIFNGENVVGGLDFGLTDAKIHKLLIDILALDRCTPADVYEKSVVKSVNKLIIPAYWFDNCSGMATAQYEKGLEKEYREVVSDDDDGIRVETKYRTEWFPMSIAVSESTDFLVSASKQYNEIFKMLYSNTHSPAIIDVKKLEYPADCTAVENDTPEAVAFNQTVKALMEDAINKKAVSTLNAKNIRNIQLNGISIHKGDVSRVAVGIYEIVVEYGGTDYYIYLSGDGVSYAYSTLPSDSNLEALLAQKDEAIKAADSGKRVALIITAIVLAVIGVLTLAAIVGVVFLAAAAVVWFCFGAPVQKEYSETVKRLEEEKKNIMGEIDVIKQNFKNRKVALAGVLNHVSGDPEAF